MQVQGNRPVGDRATGTQRTLASALVAVLAAALGVAIAATTASAGVAVQRMFMPGYKPPGVVGEAQEHFIPPAPARLGPTVNFNRVGVIRVGSPKAKNVLVLEPGTSAGAGYFVPFAKSLVERLPGWQVWSVERRENLLEDQARLKRAKAHGVTGAELFRYYLGWLSEAKPPPHHFLPLTTEGPLGVNFLSAFPKQAEELNSFGSGWGMVVAVEDLHRVIERAKALGGKVVLGGHSLGGSVVTAYATWDFSGAAGADPLAGLVYDDGGSSQTPVSKEQAEEELAKLKARTSPWLAFGGIGAPFLGLFSALGSTSTVVFPEEASLAETFPFLPEDLKPKSSPSCKASEPGCLIPVTNEAEFGYGVNVGTSPPALIAAQVHAGAGIEEAAKADGLHGWSSKGALTPLRRYAEMLSGTGLREADGTEWYFPERLTIDTGAVAEGNANPAQEVLYGGEHAIHGHELPKSLKILAIDSELDKLLGGTSLQTAEILAEQSGIPKENLTLIEEENAYAHNDPAGADPEAEGLEGNAFYKKLVPFLEGLH